MNKLLFIPLILFFFGVILLGYGIMIGEVTVGLAVFIPFIISRGFFGFLGITFLFLSMLSLFFIFPKLSWDQYQQNIPSEYEHEGFKSSSERKINGGGVIFLGPIPIVFGSNKKIARYMILTSIIILIIMLFYASLLLNE